MHLIVTGADSGDEIGVELLVDAELDAGHVGLKAEVVAGGLLAVEHAEGIDPDGSRGIGVYRLPVGGSSAAVLHDARQLARAAHRLGQVRLCIEVRGGLRSNQVGLARVRLRR